MRHKKKIGTVNIKRLCAPFLAVNSENVRVLLGSKYSRISKVLDYT